jgi:hypothetical protein
VVRARDSFDASRGTQFANGGLDLVANRMYAAAVLLRDRFGRSAARHLDEDTGFSFSEQRGGVVMPKRSKRGGDRFGKPLLVR